MFVWLWVGLFTAGLVVEGFALLNKKRHDTLSEQVWFLRTVFWARLIMLPLWMWLTWHFFIEPPHWGPAFLWIDDFIVILLGVLAAILVRYRIEQ